MAPAILVSSRYCDAMQNRQDLQLCSVKISNSRGKKQTYCCNGHEVVIT